MVNHATIAKVREVFEAMPKDQPPRGQKPEWGPPGNRARAYYLAATIGHVNDPNCQSCDADVFDFLQSEVKAADAFAMDRKAMK